MSIAEYSKRDLYWIMGSEEVLERAVPGLHEWAFAWLRDHERHRMLCETLSARLRDLINSGVSKDLLARRIGCSKAKVTVLSKSDDFKPHWIPGLIYGLGIGLGAPNIQAAEMFEKTDDEYMERLGFWMSGRVTNPKEIGDCIDTSQKLGRIPPGMRATP